MFAIWFVILVALVGLGSLAAVVFGIVYAIAKKRPGVALGSVLVPVAAFFGVCLAGMMWVGFRSSGHMGGHGPIQVSWSNIPPMPAAPAMPPVPIGVEGVPAAVGPLFSFGPILLVFLFVGALCFAFFGKRGNCGGANGARRFSWGKAIIGIVVAIVLLKYTTFPFWQGSQRHVAWNHADAMRAAEEQVRQTQEQARRQIEVAKRIADEATEKAAAVQVEGKNFQEMLEQLTEPRIELDAEGAKVTVEAETKPAAAVTADTGKAKLVVPISAQTQESLARTAKRLELMVDQVAVVAEQVSDAGTLLGKAMVALNERIDSSSKAPAELAAAPAAIAAAAAMPAEVPAEPVAEAMAHSEPQPTSEALKEIGLDDLATNTIEIQVDPVKLHQIGLSFEKLKEILSREGLWHGTVVRFDADKLLISTQGKFEQGYFERLLNTLVYTVGQQRLPIHLRDVADVKALEPIPVAKQDGSSKPAWIDKPPHKIGNAWREVVATEEYSTPEECARAADVLLLFKTYDHLAQILGSPRSEQPLPSLTFYTESGQIAADGKIVYRSDGKYGEWLDYRLKMLADMGVGSEFVRREMVPENGEYYATAERSAGPMTKLYTMLEFRPSVDSELRRRWEELRRGERFAVVGAGAGSVLGLLGLAFGLLKVDTWTKGYYSKRLFLGVPAAIIGGLALLSWAAGM